MLTPLEFEADPASKRVKDTVESTRGRLETYHVRMRASDPMNSGRLSQ
jgi:hypothetical protein